MSTYRPSSASVLLWGCTILRQEFLCMDLAQKMIPTQIVPVPTPLLLEGATRTWKLIALRCVKLYKIFRLFCLVTAWTACVNITRSVDETAWLSRNTGLLYLKVENYSGLDGGDLTSKLGSWTKAHDWTVGKDGFAIQLVDFTELDNWIRFVDKKIKRLFWPGLFERTVVFECWINCFTKLMDRTLIKCIPR